MNTRVELIRAITPLVGIVAGAWIGWGVLTSKDMDSATRTAGLGFAGTFVVGSYALAQSGARHGGETDVRADQVSIHQEDSSSANAPDTYVYNPPNLSPNRSRVPLDVPTSSDQELELPGDRSSRNNLDPTNSQYLGE